MTLSSLPRARQAVRVLFSCLSARLQPLAGLLQPSFFPPLLILPIQALA